MKKKKIAIIGGGIIGCSIAYYLSRSDSFDIVVFERQLDCGAWETAHTVAMIMHQADTPWLCELAKESIKEYERLNENKPIGYKRTGSILYTTTDKDTGHKDKRVREVMDFQKNLGIEVREIFKEEIKKLVPFVHTDDIIVGSFCPNDGVVDPSIVKDFFEKGARDSGVSFFTGAIARLEIDKSGERIILITTRQDKEENRFSDFDYVINAAGGLGHLVARGIGEELKITNRTRCVAVFAHNSSEQANEFNNFPIIEDVGFFWYIRPYDNDTILFGQGPSPNYEIVDDSGKIKEHPRLTIYNAKGIDQNKSEFYDSLYNYLSKRAPGILNCPIEQTWIGVRSYHEQPNGDYEPIISFSANSHQLIHCCGMSAFGISIAPAVAKKVVRMIDEAKN